MKYIWKIFECENQLIFFILYQNLRSLGSYAFLFSFWWYLTSLLSPSTLCCASMYMYVFHLSMRQSKWTIHFVGWLVCLWREHILDSLSKPLCVDWMGLVRHRTLISRRHTIGVPQYSKSLYMTNFEFCLAYFPA